MEEKELVAIWFNYQEVAMHFNEMLIQFRLQLMGGLGAVGTVGGYLIGGKVQGRKQRAWLRSLFLSGLTVLMFAAAILDLGYYNRLLLGAVKAVVALEKRVQIPKLDLSTTIEASVGGTCGVYVAYGIVLFFMVVTSALSWFDWRKVSPGESHQVA